MVWAPTGAPGASPMASAAASKTVILVDMAALPPQNRRWQPSRAGGGFVKPAAAFRIAATRMREEACDDHPPRLRSGLRAARSQPFRDENRRAAQDERPALSQRARRLRQGAEGKDPLYRGWRP